MTAFKFAPTASAEKPDNEITQLLERAMRKESLTRDEKDRVADLLYGLFGAHCGGQYRLAGWCWNLRQALPRFLVRYEHDDRFVPYYAPDKTSLRNALVTPIAEIVGPVKKGATYD